MKRNSGNSFGNFGKIYSSDDFSVKPIKAEFGGSIPNSLYTVNRQSAWSRWRRGYELATASIVDNSFDYSFNYLIPIPAGTPGTGGTAPAIPGILKGFPTKNKELGMH